MLSEHRGVTCQHRSDDFATIAGILARRQPRIAVELGTDRGGFAAFLADTILPWHGHAWTFDRERKFDAALLDGRFPNLDFLEADVLSAPHPFVAALAALRPCVLLYCDDGNKRRELEIYAPLLRPGSLLGVHDYGTEVDPEWAEPFVAALGYAPEGHAEMEALRNEWYPEPMTRFWIRREELP